MIILSKDRCSMITQEYFIYHLAVYKFHVELKSSFSLLWMHFGPF